MDLIWLLISFTLIFILTNLMWFLVLKNQNQIISTLQDQNQKQSELLSVKDLTAYAALQYTKPQDNSEPVETETDDDIAFRECAARPGGLTDDEKLYFRAKGYEVAD